MLLTTTDAEVERGVDESAWRCDQLGNGKHDRSGVVQGVYTYADQRPNGTDTCKHTGVDDEDHEPCDDSVRPNRENMSRVSEDEQGTMAHRLKPVRDE